MTADKCELCATDGGRLVLADEFLRVVLVDDADFPGFTRVIWHAHAREMSDLAPGEQQRLMRAVFAVERAQRDVLAPAKVNLASLGNLTPHLHWHVIPRFADDSHFPQPVWGTRQRDGNAASLAVRRAQLGPLGDRIAVAVAHAGRS